MTTKDRNIVYTTEQEERNPSTTQPEYRNSTYVIVSKVAYLIGVPQRIFEMEHEAPKMEHFKELQNNKNARIVRNLCMLRTAIEQNFSEINRQICNNIKNLHTLPELIPQECLTQLSADGIQIVKANCKPNQYIIAINKHIGDRINNCKNLFPIWIDWNYIKALFIMPNGLTEAGLRSAANEYYTNRNRYPYHVYINWCYRDAGNILYNDKKFVQLLYEANEDRFDDISKVSDASDQAKESIYEFLEGSERVAVVVDCENSDPFKLVATLNNLNKEKLLDKICKIILCDDVHTTTAWDIVNEYTQIPVEHLEVPRISVHKSIVDQTLCVKAVMEHYENNVDAIILFGSDSDYWGLFGLFKKVRYFVMVESEKFGGEHRAALLEAGIPFCYIDNFCTGNSNQIKIQAMLREVRRALDEALKLNVDKMLEDAYTATRADMSVAEEKQFYDRYIKKMRLIIQENGDLYIALGE